MFAYLNPHLCEKVYPLYVLRVGVWMRCKDKGGTGSNPMYSFHDAQSSLWL